MNSLTITSLSVVGDEPRVLDVDLAVSLGFALPRQIRELIARNIDELHAHGNLSCDATNSGKRGRPAKAYYLNEAQALLLCMFSRTNRAADVRKQLIEVFTAWRLGKTVHVREHHRRPPSPPAPSIQIDFAWDPTDRGLCTLNMLVPFEFAQQVMRDAAALA